MDVVEGYRAGAVTSVVMATGSVDVVEGYRAGGVTSVVMATGSVDAVEGHRVGGVLKSSCMWVYISASWENR